MDVVTAVIEDLYAVTTIDTVLCGIDLQNFDVRLIVD